MDTKTFLRKVQKKANLIDEDAAIKATQAVLQTLHHRILEGEADNVEATLPTEIKKLWEGDITTKISRGLGGVEKLDKDEFIFKIQRMVNTKNPEQTEKLTSAVISVLKEAIPEGEIEDMKAQLPQDLRDFVEAA